jgi:hypothetical protein
MLIELLLSKRLAFAVIPITVLNVEMSDQEAHCSIVQGVVSENGPRLLQFDDADFTFRFTRGV